jgi:putative FmdB family regulatory protein
MPIYEYECEQCGPFEVIQKISDRPIKKCETCGNKVRKLVSQSSFTLKGGGWYKDLYATPKSADKTTKGSGGDSSAGSSSTGSSGSSDSGEPGDSGKPGPRKAESGRAPAPAPAKKDGGTKSAASASAAA